MPVADAIAGLTGVEGVFAFDADQQAFLRFLPRLPSVSTLEELRPGDGVWLLRSGDIEPWQIPDLAHARTVVLRPGFNLAAWTGPDTPIEEALGDAIAGVISAFTWDLETQGFRAFRPGFPAFANTLAELRHGDGLWIEVDDWTIWNQPAP